MKTTTIVLGFVSWILLTGCEKNSDIAELDEKTQLEIAELERRLDEDSARFRAGRNPGPAQVVPASTNSNQVSPANSASQFNAPEVVSTNTSDAETASSGTPKQILDKADTRLNKFSTPEVVCEHFLSALEKGDYITANQMLTNIAQIETSRAELQLESPGSEGSTFEIMAARYATTEKLVAEVLCILHLPEQEDAVRLTWMLRFQYNGWKISGMSIQMNEIGSVDLLSFENPSDLQRIQSSIDEGGNASLDSSSQTARQQIPRNDLINR